uniref:Uncharacterized protein AlNc14C92G5719 n=1 Tax=Albugo laibachii Nc14 TaxID=890382 RepID=F0WGI5_9STRA|nr:conserved hypothetical protein [Albugo laibachii Nc14]|eukprot:CCA20349.1 conserved hypothetical protein [Albugo laibachii Nc14]
MSDTTQQNEVFETPDQETSFQPYIRVPSSYVHAFERDIAYPGRYQDDTKGYLDKANAEIDESVVAPVQAFEAFMGKIYQPNYEEAYEAKGALKTNAQTQKSTTFESPIERYTRLMMEANELEEDLIILSKENQQTNVTGKALDTAREAEMEYVIKGVNTLKQNLTAMQRKDSYQTFLQESQIQMSLDQNMSTQKKLSGILLSQIEEMKKYQVDEVNPAESGPNMVYEIYHTGEVDSSERDTKQRVVVLESRIAALERMVGSFYNSQGHLDALGSLEGNDLVSIVTKMEKRVALLNETNLDAIKARTNALVHEFTLLSKLKESSASQIPKSSRDESQMLGQLYEKLQSVEDVACMVPSLVERLSTLKEFHEESMDWSQRLGRVEDTNIAIEELLERDLQLLQNMQQSLAANAELFQANTEKLDTRLNALAV